MRNFQLQAIHGYRETEKSKWGPKTQFILQRVRDCVFSSEATQLPLVHVLDLAENGYIKAHVDSVKVSVGVQSFQMCVLCEALSVDLSF